MTSHDETLILQLLGDIAWRRAGNLNPGLGEDSAGREHESNVDDRVDWVQKSFAEVDWWGHVVSKTGDGVELSRSLSWLPDTEASDEEVLGESAVKHLGNQEDVGAKGGLEHNWHVAGIEETNWVGS